MMNPASIGGVLGGVAMGVMAVQMVRKYLGMRAQKQRMAKAEAERKSRRG